MNFMQRWADKCDEFADRMDAKAEAGKARAAELEARLAEQRGAVKTAPSLRVRGAKFEGAHLSGEGVRYKGTLVPLPATARVETAGEVRRRATLSRTVMTGGIGFFFLKKKVDDRELYLTVEGAGESFVLQVDPKKGKAAREFAAAVNSAAR